MPLIIEILIVDADSGLALDRAAEHTFAGMAIFVLVPVQHRTQLAAIIAEPAPLRALALIDAEVPRSGIVADVTRLDDDEILAVMRIGTMAIDGDLAADTAVVEGKSPEMLGDQDDRVALAFVGTKGPRRHHPITFETQRQTIIVKPRN